jgi:transcriptional regulator with XRE-family HTH domain
MRKQTTEAHKNTLRQAIAKNLRNTRETREWTQTAVADLFNPPLSRAAVAQWEIGEALPDIDRLAVLSKAFGVTIDSLVFGEDATAPRELTPDAIALARRFMELGGKHRALVVSLVNFKP